MRGRDQRVGSEEEDSRNHDVESPTAADSSRKSDALAFRAGVAFDSPWNRHCSRTEPAGRSEVRLRSRFHSPVGAGTDGRKIQYGPERRPSYDEYVRYASA